MEESPFIKQLVVSDRKKREAALESLRLYLASKRDFTPLELLKLHKALFFAMWHQDRAIPQQNLATSLADLSLSLSRQLFVPYMTAFWQTMAREWTNIDALRMDKFLRLSRVQVNAGFEWLRRQKWRPAVLAEYIAMVRTWPLSPPVENRKVGDGLRYHVLDVWVDELEKVDGEKREAPVEKLMAPVRMLVKEANTKALRSRAKECAGDERLGDREADANGTDAVMAATTATTALAADVEPDGAENSGGSDASK